jgi:hypothetical protein
MHERNNANLGMKRKKAQPRVRSNLGLQLSHYATDQLKTWFSPSDITFDGNFLNLFTKAGNLRAWSFAPFRSVKALWLFQSRWNFLRDGRTLGVSRDEVEGFRVSASLMLDDMCRNLQ